MSNVKCQMSYVKCQMSIRLTFCRSVPPEFLWSFLAPMDALFQNTLSLPYYFFAMKTIGRNIYFEIQSQKTLRELSSDYDAHMGMLSKSYKRDSRCRFHFEEHDLQSACNFLFFNILSKSMAWDAWCQKVNILPCHWKTIMVVVLLEQ